METQLNAHSFYATLSANIEFSDAEFKLICEHAAHHYDSTVKSTVEVGGFLFGAKGSREWALKNQDQEAYKHYKFREYNSRQIQLILKAIEFTQSSEAAQLYWRIQNILKEMYKKQEDLNKTINN